MSIFGILYMTIACFLGFWITMHIDWSDADGHNISTAAVFIATLLTVVIWPIGVPVVLLVTANENKIREWLDRHSKDQ